jgi:tetratricopeptide (TPR) repeat protein
MAHRFLASLLALFTICSGLIAQPANVDGQSSTAPQSTNPTRKSGVTIQLAAPPQAPAQNARTGAPGDEKAALAMADRLLASGKPAEAQAKYQAIVNVDPDSVPAQVGVVRALFIQQKLDEAQSAIDTALALHPNSPDLILTLGDLQFAQGKIGDSEHSFIKAENLNPKDAAPYLGLARVYRAASLYRRAYDNMKRAHELAPNDVPVQLSWFNSLAPPARIPSLESYLAKPNLDPGTAKALQQYLAFLKKSASQPMHPCKLISKVAKTDTKLYALPRSGTDLGASGLVVKVNDQELHLALDTGASGVLLGGAAAGKLGLQRLGYQSIVGMGGAGEQGGYRAVADRIRVGDLEFQDCVVRVAEASNPVTGQDGLIGADVFSSYLIDIDIPGAKLRLSPLPKRPNAPETPAALATVAADNPEVENDAPGVANAAATNPDAIEMLYMPKDAYVSPDMANWTKVFRFRSQLLVPTRVDNTGPMLFLIDTGSYANVLSTETARELTAVRSDPSVTVRGLSGSVGQIYRADKATLQFGRYVQDNQDVVTFDLSSISRQTGTHVAGILGFNMLRILQTRIDYRDGLVDFVFDPKHLPKQIKLNKPD